MKENSDKSKDASLEKPAVKTTIVGGRPPGSGKETDAIPRGIEILVKKASVDAAFKEALLKERAAAASRIDLVLENFEESVINTIPQPHLEGMISATQVSPNMRQIFLGCTAAVMLAALTATASAADDRQRWLPEGGIRPIYGPAPGGIRPDMEIREPSSYDREATAMVGTVGCEVIDAVSGKPLDSAEVRFQWRGWKAPYPEDEKEFVVKIRPRGERSSNRVSLPAGQFFVSAHCGDYLTQHKTIRVLRDQPDQWLEFKLKRK